MHMISFPHCMQRTLHQNNVLPPTHTQSLVFFSPQNVKHYHTYMHAGRLSVCQHISAELSIHPSLSSPSPPVHLIPCLPPSLPSHLPGLQQGHTPQLPCACTRTNTQTHTITHMHKEQERECDGREDKKGGGESRFHATLSTG